MKRLTAKQKSWVLGPIWLGLPLTVAVLNLLGLFPWQLSLWECSAIVLPFIVVTYVIVSLWM